MRHGEVYVGSMLDSAAFNIFITTGCVYGVGSVWLCCCFCLDEGDDDREKSTSSDDGNDD